MKEILEQMLEYLSNLNSALNNLDEDVHPHSYGHSFSRMNDKLYKSISEKIDNLKEDNNKC